MRICMLGQSLYLMLLSYCFICSEIWEAIGTNDCFLEYRITCDDEEERASRRVYRGCIRSPTCKGCTSCVCFGCDICRFSDCSCQTCIDFTRNAKTWISGVISSTWLFLSLVGIFMTIVVSWKSLPRSQKPSVMLLSLTEISSLCVQYPFSLTGSKTSKWSNLFSSFILFMCLHYFYSVLYYLLISFGLGGYVRMYFFLT